MREHADRSREQLGRLLRSGRSPAASPVGSPLAVLAPPAAPAGGERTDAAPGANKIPKVSDMHANFVKNSLNAWKNQGELAPRGKVN